MSFEYPKEYKGQKVYGTDDWSKGFQEQFKPGDLFNVEIANWFLNCVPPKCYSQTYVQCGEPYSHRQNKDGQFQAVYVTLEAVKGTFSDSDSVWKYCGVCFKGEHEEVKE